MGSRIAYLVFSMYSKMEIKSLFFLRSEEEFNAADYKYNGELTVLITPLFMSFRVCVEVRVRMKAMFGWMIRLQETQ